MMQNLWKRTRANLGIRTDNFDFGLPVTNERFSSAAEIEVAYRQLRQERSRLHPGIALSRPPPSGVPCRRPADRTSTIFIQRD